MLDAGQPPEEVVCFAYSTFDIDAAMRLAEHVADVALPLERWADRTPRTPTKWSVVADLWTKALGKRYSAETWRRWDPRKKQTLPGRGRRTKPD
jgi:hypothetical protein